ncbi:MAG TPA: FmdB family zinc ribbon protein [candidate division Zixibacteria bacterium]|nr:FmdB family zinc ribbon protein [candidate division Zixibacteria bacterium]
MPIYEYACRRCGHSFEQVVLSKSEQIRCPKCDSRSITKQLSVFRSPAARAAGESTAPTGGCGCTPQGCGCR